jgi:hypothetical protein
MGIIKTFWLDSDETKIDVGLQLSSISFKWERLYNFENIKQRKKACNHQVHESIMLQQKLEYVMMLPN